MTAPIDDILELAPVMPVLTINDLSESLPMAEALVAAGLPVLEVTLRTDCAIDAIRHIARELPSATVGAGTVTTVDQLRAVESVAAFAVSPGFSAELCAYAQGESPIPLLPGVATASEVMAARSAGYYRLKFFPAEASGGTRALKALAGPFPDVRFCPTGGIDFARAAGYLALTNVDCVGGSWMVPSEAVTNRDWPTVRELGAQAAALAADPVRT